MVWCCSNSLWFCFSVRYSGIRDTYFMCFKVFASLPFSHGIKHVLRHRSNTMCKIRWANRMCERNVFIVINMRSKRVLEQFIHPAFYLPKRRSGIWFRVSLCLPTASIWKFVSSLLLSILKFVTCIRLKLPSKCIARIHSHMTHTHAIQSDDGDFCINWSKKKKRNQKLCHRKSCRCWWCLRRTTVWTLANLPCAS